MVKNFLKRTLCIVLSFAMMTGTVMVGAKNKNRKYSQQTSCDHSITKSKSKTGKSICSGSAVKCNECLHAV